MTLLRYPLIFTALVALFALCTGFADTALAVGSGPGRIVTGAIHWPGNKVQFFYNDGTYVRYDVKADRTDKGYPQAITNETWPGLAPYARQIVAACDGPQGKAYVFLANGTYLRYDIAADRVDPGYPAKVTDKTWPGLGAYGDMIVASLNWPGGKIQFFLNDGRYVRYDVAKDRADDGYPQDVTKATWPGLSPYRDHLAGMVNWGNGKAYMFLDDGTYLRYDISADHVDDGYPKPVDNANWPGMAE